MINQDSQTLETLTNTSENDRNSRWETDFFHALTSGHVELLSPDPQQGPDGWPYLMVKTSAQASEPAQKIIQWLAQKGMGLAVNPQKDYPDYVFTYGMLWHFRETGFFYKQAGPTPSGQVEMNLQNIKHAGTPTESYLPLYVRKILKEFFRDQGVLNPKILVVSLDGVNYELAFSLESLGFPKDAEHEGICEAISWFLPPHYSLVLISEKEMPPFSEL